MTRQNFIGALSPTRLSVISGARQNLGWGAITIATATNYDNARVRHVNLTGKEVKSIVLAYANYGPSSSKERANGNAINIKASVEFEGTAADQTKPRVPVSFDGLLNPTIDPWGVVYSKPVHGRLPAGAQFYERIRVGVPANGNIYQCNTILQGGTAGFGKDTGEGANTNTISDRITDFGSAMTDAASRCYSASVVLGELADGTVATSVALLGDSIMAGNDDAGYGNILGGWGLRLFDAYPHIYLPFAGEKLQDVAVLSNNYSRFELSSFTTHVLAAYGRNDLGAGRTAAQMKADLLAYAKPYMARGQTFIFSTILPCPSSTDGWFTVTNQTKEPTEAVRVAFNQWLRDPSASGFVAQANAQVADVPSAGVARYADPCAPIECDINGVLTQDGGYFLGAQSGILTSGTATSGANQALNDTSKAWTVNQFVGKSVYIASGTGAGQSRCIGFNTATQLGIAQNWVTNPDATSVYQVFEALGQMGSAHPHTKGHVMIAAGMNAASLLA